MLGPFRSEVLSCKRTKTALALLELAVFSLAFALRLDLENNDHLMTLGGTCTIDSRGKVGLWCHKDLIDCPNTMERQRDTEYCMGR